MIEQEQGKMTIDFAELEIPDYALAGKTQGIVYPRGGPLFYRFDGKDGFFYKGVDVDSDTLYIRPFDIRPHFSARWGRLAQSWLDVAFIDESNVASIISFAGDSRKQMLSDFASIEMHDIKYHSIKLGLSNREINITIEQEDGTETEGLYHIAQVESLEFLPEPEVLKIEEFIKSSQFEWILPGEIE
jgi:hypothetical protein